MQISGVKTMSILDNKKLTKGSIGLDDELDAAHDGIISGVGKPIDEIRKIQGDHIELIKRKVHDHF
jgi:hypothetical protein